MNEALGAMEHYNIEIVTIKGEPGIQEGDEDGMSHGELDIHLTDVKKECLDHTEEIPQTAGKIK